ncbi:hypothetical protein TKK_0011683 [Trichogramma kaykai]
MEDISVCVICNKDINIKPSRIIKKASIDTLCKSSKKKMITSTRSSKNIPNSKFIRHIASETYMSKYKTFLKNSQKISITNSNETKKIIIASLNEMLKGNLNNALKKEIMDMKNRIEEVNFETETCRYHKSCYVKYVYRLPKNIKPGRPMKASNTSAIEFVINHLSCNYEEECQFSIQSILDQYDGEDDDINIKTIVDKVEDYFASQIIVYPVNKSKDYIVCFRHTSKLLLGNEWYKNKNQDPAEDRKRIVETAAEIILDDIRSKFYDVSEYPAPNCFLENIDDIPVTLKLFLETTLKKKKKHQN